MRASPPSSRKKFLPPKPQTNLKSKSPKRPRNQFRLKQFKLKIVRAKWRLKPSQMQLEELQSIWLKLFIISALGRTTLRCLAVCNQLTSGCSTMESIAKLSLAKLESLWQRQALLCVVKSLKIPKKWWHKQLKMPLKKKAQMEFQTIWWNQSLMKPRKHYDRPRSRHSKLKLSRLRLISCKMLNVSVLLWPGRVFANL